MVIISPSGPLEYRQPRWPQVLITLGAFAGVAVLGLFGVLVYTVALLVWGVLEPLAEAAWHQLIALW